MFSTWYNSQSNEVLIDNSTIKWVDSSAGPIQIYQEPAPGEAYVIGADTAGEGSDFNVGQVVCHGSGRQVCTVRGQMDEDLFAKQLYCLGVTYSPYRHRGQLLQLPHPGAGAAALPPAVRAPGGGQLHPPPAAELRL